MAYRYVAPVTFSVIACLTSFGCEPSSKNIQTVEQRISLLLIAEEFDNEIRDEILSYGDRAMSVIEDILSSRQNDEIDELRVSRALNILSHFGSGAQKLHPLVLKQLVAENALVRNSAVYALASIGSSKDVPIVVAMLYDPDKSVRRGAVRVLGNFGDESAILAIEVWQKQAIDADRDRALQEKWFIGSMTKAVDESKAAIKQRIEGRPAKAE
jgi:HEAT repeat protein